MPWWFRSIIGGLALMGLATPTCVAGTLPPNYVDLIRHENYTAAEALAEAQIARAQADGGSRPDLLCAALEQRIRINFFDTDQPLATKVAIIERALHCREDLANSADNAAHIAWLKANLAALAVTSYDGQRAPIVLAEVAALIKQYREQLGATDYAIAAHYLGIATSGGSDFTGAFGWTHAGVVAASGGDVLSRLIRARLLIAECYRLGRLGRFIEAEAAGNAGVELAGQMFGMPSIYHAYALHHLGQVQYFAHHFADAGASMERAIADDRQLGLPARYDLAGDLMVWGNLQGEIGNYERGRVALTEAIAIERGNTSFGHHELAAMLSNLGLLEAEAGHCDAAMPSLREALQMEQQRRDADNSEISPILGTLGQCELDAGQVDKARADISLALSTAVKTLGEHNSQIAEYYADMARVELAERDYAAATQRLQKALSVLPDDADTLSAVRIPIERNLARSLHGQHQDEAAFEHAVAAETARQRLLQHFAGALDESGGLNLHETLLGGMDQVLALAAERKDPTWTARAWQLQIGSRALITRLVAARLKAARDSADPQMQALWENWKKANTAYAAALLDIEAGKTKETSFAAPRDALENAERAIARSIPGLGETATPEIAALGASLPAHSALVGFALSRDVAWAGDRAGIQHDPQQRYYAFRLDAVGTAALIDLGDARELSAAVHDWTAALRDPARSFTDIDALGKDVARRLWQPLDLPNDLRHVFLVPEGELHRLAWLALPLQHDLLVTNGPVPILLDSERDLLAAAADNTLPQHVLLVGAVSPDPSIATGVCGDALHALPGAQRELDALREMWKEAGNGNAAWLIGRDANKAAVRAGIAQSTIIHFATHAFSDGTDCTRHLFAARGIRLVNSTMPTNALAVSGLLLAPNPRASAVADRDGLLTAPEIAALRLDGVNTITLAACDTGTGPVRSDEGVFGLARAFRVAGARSVVMSLWNVDDASTADLMQHMYRARWVDHEAVADALAAAAHATLAARRASGQDVRPFYWAAFVAAGNWH